MRQDEARVRGCRPGRPQASGARALRPARVGGATSSVSDPEGLMRLARSDPRRCRRSKRDRRWRRPRWRSARACEQCRAWLALLPPWPGKIVLTSHGGGLQARVGTAKESDGGRGRTDSRAGFDIRGSRCPPSPRRGEHRGRGHHAQLRDDPAHATSSPSSTSSCSSSASRCWRWAATATPSPASGSAWSTRVISAAQEIRAKRKLDRLQLLDGRRCPSCATAGGGDRAGRGRARRRAAGAARRPDRGRRPVARRAGRGRRVAADRRVRPGRQGPGRRAALGQPVRRGGGPPCSPATSAPRSYAGRLTAEARRTTTDATPLQRRIAFVVRLVIALTVLMSGAILAQAALEGFTLLRIVQITAVLSGLVPYGLFFLIARRLRRRRGHDRGPRRAGAAGQRGRVGRATSTSCAPTRPAR